LSYGLLYALEKQDRLLI